MRIATDVCWRNGLSLAKQELRSCFVYYCMETSIFAIAALFRSSSPRLLNQYFYLEQCGEQYKSFKVIFGNATVSSSSPKTYWSLQQSDVQSRCTVSSTTALQVSSTVLVSRLFQCPFAVKSDGHAAFAGASSIDSGSTVDLVNMKVRKLADDKKTVAIGPGNRWLDVYNYLTPDSLVVVGGRVSDIHVTLD
jgi:hypothetical protein